MATVAFTSFLPEVLPQVPACSDVVAINAIRNACIDFCVGSSFWNETLDSESVTDTDFPYQLVAPSGARVTLIMSMSMNGFPVVPAFLDALEHIQGWSDHTASQPQYYCHASPDRVFVYPRLDTSASMVLRLAYAPSRAASAVDSNVYQEYLEEIAKGALGRLMKMPGQAWSNPELGVYYATEFEKAVINAGVRVNKSFARSEPSIIMRPLA